MMLRKLAESARTRKLERTIVELQAKIASIEAEHRNRVRKLEADLEIERSKLRVRDAEIDELSKVIARNAKRVEAEIAAAARGLGNGA